MAGLFVDVTFKIFFLMSDEELAAYTHSEDPLERLAAQGELLVRKQQIGESQNAVAHD